MKNITQNNPFIIMADDGKRIDIHPEFRIIFDFLIQLEQEIKELMSYKKRLKELKKQCVEIFDILLKMKLDEKSKFTLSEHPETLANKFHFIRPIRSEFIVLFAHLETLRCLHTAYQNKTSDKKELRDASDGAMDKFIKEFCLTKNNQWVLDNPKRSGKISAKNLRDLRNSLTHFFSVNKIGLVPLYDNETEKISNKINNKIQFLSPEDFEKILYFAARLLLKKWSDDCKKSLRDGNNDFVERMRCVKDIVEQNGAKFLYENLKK